MRLLRIPATPKFALGALPGIPHKWAFPSVSTLNPFSAVCALTGEKLARQLNIPIGLIQSAVGGTPIESWISYANLLTYPNAVSLLSNLQKAKSFETVLPPEVRSCMDVQTANVLYDGMINPLKVHSVKGVLWYQGEGNTPRSFEYQYLLPLLVKSFRDHFNNPTLPFFVVQLPNFADGAHWEELRWVQQDAANHLANVYTIPTLDLGESQNIHPLNKAPIAQRLYALIMRNLYGSGIIATGPVFSSAQINGSGVIVYFSLKGTGSVLAVRGGGTKIGGFTIAGSDGVFYPAQATISSANSVMVTSGMVPAPLFVRYAWSSDTSDANLMSVKGWPVFPFRTDILPFATINRSLADRPICTSSALKDTLLDKLPE
jgi:sialate O-acetylesterase